MIPTVLQNAAALFRDSPGLRPLYLDPAKCRMLDDPDCLSVDVFVQRNPGGTIGDRETVPYVPLTPELLELIKAARSA